MSIQTFDTGVCSRYHSARGGTCPVSSFKSFPSSTLSVFTNSLYPAVDEEHHDSCQRGMESEARIVLTTEPLRQLGQEPYISLPSTKAHLTTIYIYADNGVGTGRFLRSRSSAFVLLFSMMSLFQLLMMMMMMTRQKDRIFLFRSRPTIRSFRVIIIAALPLFPDLIQV